MTPSILIVALVLLSFLAYQLGKARSLAVVGGARGIRNLHSLPGHYGLLTALWCGLPALLLVAVWVAVQDQVLIALVSAQLPASVQSLGNDQFVLFLNDLRNVVAGNIPASQVSPETAAAAAEYLRLQGVARLALAALAFSIGIIAMLVVRGRIRADLRARNSVERVLEGMLFLCSLVAVLTTIGIILSVVFEATRFFGIVPAQEFLFGTKWSPQMAIRADQVGSTGAFGALPLFAGTFLIMLIAMTVAAPVGLFAAIYLSEYAGPVFRATVKPVLEILAGVPTVVYGFFAALTVGPAFREFFNGLGTLLVGGPLDGLGQYLMLVQNQMALVAGAVMGIMLIPFVSSLSDDIINAVPQSLRDGSYAMGATRSETVKRVLLPAALPGVAGAMLLAMSRAIGETMIVTMAAGLAASLTLNPLDTVTTVTVQIVTLLTGDQEFNSTKTLSAFGLGLTLFLVTLVLNIVAQRIVQTYRQQYD